MTLYMSRLLALFPSGQPTLFLSIFNHLVSKKLYSNSRTLQITHKSLFYWLRSTDTINSSLLTEQKTTLEGQVLEQVEEASANLGAVHAVLWKAYKGIVGVQDRCTMWTEQSTQSATSFLSSEMPRSPCLSRASLLTARLTWKLLRFYRAHVLFWQLFFFSSYAHGCYALNGHIMWLRLTYSYVSFPYHM